jgi:hypothetical protein
MAVAFFTGTRGIVRLWLPRLFVSKSVTVKKATVAWLCGAAKKDRDNVRNEHSGFFCCGVLCRAATEMIVSTDKNLLE